MYFLVVGNFLHAIHPSMPVYEDTLSLMATSPSWSLDTLHHAPSCCSQVWTSDFHCNLIRISGIIPGILDILSFTSSIKLLLLDLRSLRLQLVEISRQDDQEKCIVCVR